MVGSSKILTVSYGTFSCTLEGFDDSFSTMKAIAEYFRDLAADDRYFGAEPPTPDAEMLARIAEREVARRVEARLDDNGSGIVLKTGSALAAVGLADTDEAADAAPATEDTPAPEAAAEEQAPAPQPAEEVQDFVAEEVEPEETAPVMPPVAEAPVQPQAFDPAALMSTDTYEDEDEPQDVAPTAYSAPADETPAHLDADSVAAKLQRIRAVVGRGGAAAPQDGSDTPASLFSQPEEDLEEAITDTAGDDAAEDIAEAAEDHSTPLQVEAVEEDVAEVEEQIEEAIDEMVAETDETAAAGEETSEAEDEVTAPEADAADDEDPIVSEAPALDAASLGILSDAIAAEGEDETSEAEDNAEADDTVEAAAEEDDTPLDLSDIMADASDDQDEDSTEETAEDTSDDLETAAEADADPQDDAETAETDDGDSPAPVRARVIRMRRSAVDAALAAGTLTEETDNDIAELQERMAEADELDGYGEPDVADDGALYDDLGASAEAETEAEDAEDLARLDGADADADADDEDDTPESSLSPDAEAELQAELAALVGGIETEDDAVVTEDTLNIEAEDELIDDLATLAEDEVDTDLDAISEAEDQVAEALETAEETVEAAVEDTAAEAEEAVEDFEAEVAEDAEAEDGPEETAAGPLRPRRVTLPGGIDEGDASLDRIMSQTEAQMSAPDSSRRRESLEQLKAAVAATEADRELADGSEEDGDSAEETFRDDLRQVVRPTRPIRPQRPTDRGERTERPAPAPLKLVASQRVDLPEEEAAAEETPRQPVMPVRPRRVMQTEEPAAASAEGSAATGGFAAFAEEMGAHELGDLLEAAAAYTSFVEGSEDFSRPQLMNKIKETSDKEYSREEGLRSFGTLLRQGRIMKVRNGRFQVSGETRFNPERRAG